MFIKLRFIWINILWMVIVQVFLLARVNSIKDKCQQENSIFSIRFWAKNHFLIIRVQWHVNELCTCFAVSFHSSTKYEQLWTDGYANSITWRYQIYNHELLAFFFPMQKWHSGQKSLELSVLSVSYYSTLCITAVEISSTIIAYKNLQWMPRMFLPLSFFAIYSFFYLFLFQTKNE